MDETGIDSYLYREYRYTLKEELGCGKIPWQKFRSTNIIAPMQYNGTTASTLFEFWFEQCTGCYAFQSMLGNASFHQKKYLLEIARKYYCTLIFLSHYSPELKLIEYL